MLLKYYRFLALIFCVLLTSCGNKEKADTSNDEVYEEQEIYNPIVENSVDTDLEDIKKDGVLKALVVYSSTSYFLYRGQPMGFEYELLKDLADDLGLKLELTISRNLDNHFEVLNRGDVDIIAQGMTITNQRKWEVDFTEYLYLTKQVLVQKKPDNYRKLSWASLQKSLIKDPIELIGDTVSIRKNSAYFERVMSLSNELGGTIHIDTLDSQLSTAEIIDMVAAGEIKYTIADENLARINASYSPILDIKVPISFTQRIAWVTRKKAKNLRNVVNEWIVKHRKTIDYKVTYNKYFKNKRSFLERNQSKYYSLNNEQISKYDETIKKYAKQIGWDWRLIASQVYQESRFDPQASSWAGAQGLMQIMPATAMDLDLQNVTDPYQSLRAGTTYLKQIYDRFDYMEDEETRKKFALASYNCGYGHILDAQRMAEKLDLDPNLWEDNVEKALLSLSYPKNYNKPFIKYGYVRGSEPVAYVSEIFERYEHYKAFF
jgi:membrane-bound lytic murein transglycosylase F